jgi:WD40 repeat protein/predicted Ser/Thr protein kinase
LSQSFWLAVICASPVALFKMWSLAPRFPAALSSLPVSRPRADNLAGQILGDYHLERVLGRGAHGVVYLARQPSLDRDVVVKVLADGRDPGALLREARLAARLDHPFAAHIYDHGVDPDSGLPWVAMERVRGTPLDKLLAITGPPPTPRAIALLERLAQVIDAAHAAGIAHGDIKPSNVVVLAEGGRSLPKLIDFGLARPLEDRGESTGGSPAYQAPERWAASPPDRAADVYAFAALAYELLSGAPPFSADSLEALRRAHESEPVAAIGRGLSSEVDAAFARALAKDREHRTASAGELAAALRRATVGGGGEALVFPAALHADLVAAAPQPVAACFAAAAAAIGPHAQTAALRRGARALCHYLGLLALASAPPSAWGGSERVRELGTRRLEPAEWLRLARDLAAGDPELHPLPELARALAGSTLDGVAALASTESVADADRERALGRDGIEALARACAAFELGSYRIAADRDGAVEGWSGPAPGPRMASPSPSPLPAAVALLDRDGAPICALSPLVIRARPSPHHAEELFLFAGAGIRGLRAVAPAAGFEIGAAAVREWLAGALAEREAAVAPEREPFVGLASYDTGDADLFVGRERELDDALNHLRAEPLLAIAGPSGVGKSSLARAGIAAAWPGETRVARFGELDGIEATPGALIVVDQLEELFTLEVDSVRRAEIAERLAGLAGAGAKVVVTIRDDFLGAARQLPRLGALIARGLQLLAPPDIDSLERIAREPVERVGYAWEDPALPREIAGAVAGEAGALALISFAGRKLWADRDRLSRRITRASYEALGGVAGALARHADAVLAAAPAAERAAIRRLLVALITAAGTRWRRPAADVLAAVGALGRAALDRLIRGRLVVSRESESGAEEIEIVHESLIDSWPALRSWRDGARAQALLREQVEEAARRWGERGEPAGMLWTGDALLDVRRLLAAPEPGLSDRARRFSGASGRAATRRRRWRIASLAVAVAGLIAAAAVFLALARRAEEARVAEGVERARAERRLARLSRERGRVELIGGEPGRALRLFESALAVEPGDPGTRFLIARARRGVDALERAIPIGAPIGGVGIDDAGARVLLQTDREISAREIDGGAELGRREAGEPRFAPRWLDAETAAFRARRGAVGLWAPATGGFAIAPHAGKSTHRLEATGVFLLLRDLDGVATLVRRRTNEALWSTGELGETGGGFVDPTRVVLAEDGRVTIRAAESGDIERELAAGDGFRRVAVDRLRDRILVITSRDMALFDSVGVERWRRPGSSLRMARFVGADVVAAVADRQDIELIDAGSGAVRARIDSEGSRIHALEISAAGLLAAAREDGAIELYRGDTGEAAGRLLGHFGAVRSIAFDGSGRRLVSGGDDGVARIWDVATATGERRLRGRLTRGSSFAPEGRMIAVRGAVIDLVTGERLETPAGHALLASRWPGGEPRLLIARDGRAAIWSPAGERAALESASDVFAGALAPSGERAAAVDRAGTLRLFGGGPAVVLEPGAGGKAREVRWLDGGALLVGRADGLVVISESGDEIAALGGDEADAVAIAGDRVAAGFNRRLALYEIAGSAREVMAIDLERLIKAVAIAPGGGAVVSCTDDGELAVHRAPTGERIADVDAHAGDCTGLAFIGDALIASAGHDRRVRVWSADRLELLAELGASVSSPALIATVAGDHLAATSLEGAAVWPVDRYGGSVEQLSAALECRVAVTLDDGRFVRRSRMPARCAARIAPDPPDRSP